MRVKGGQSFSVRSAHLHASLKGLKMIFSQQVKRLSCCVLVFLAVAPITASTHSRKGEGREKALPSQATEKAAGQVLGQYDTGG